jgi:MOSC domain-containing protein YiiM
MVKGVELRETVGRILSIGDLKVKISGETKPCKIMDEACEGLMEALNTKWRGGVFGCVLNDASVKVGDDVDWLLE